MCLPGHLATDIGPDLNDVPLWLADNMDDNSETNPLLALRRELPGVSHRPSPGYRQQLPSVESDRDMGHPDYGTYLAQLRESSENLPLMDNPVTVALHRCNERVLKPYKRLLLFVGWEPWFDDPLNCAQKFINILHPLMVMIFVLAGYVIQYAACFRRDSAGGSEAWVPKVNSSNHTIGCQSVLISQYIIPDLLHSFAYVYSFYLVRISQSEQLPTLIERVFLQTSPTQSGFLSQGRLIRVMMLLLALCVCWVILSLSAQIIHVIVEYQDISFTWLTLGATTGRILLLILMLLSFVFLDVVYTAVVINYCVQCCLLVFYIEGLQQKLKRKLIALSKGITEIAEIESHLRSLNYTTGVALSIVLFNFSTMAFLGAVRIFDRSNGFDAGMYVSTTLSVLFWISIIALPIVQAARLSAACNSLRKVGHELRVKTFVYQDVSDQDLDSFLLYTSSLNLRAKIFLVPVKTSYIMGIIVIVSFITLLLFQTEEIAEIESHLRSLNYTTGVALSIVLFNFSTMAFLGAVRIFDRSNGFDAGMYVSTTLSVLFWISIIALPIVQAARLSAACNSLRKVGHELRVKTFVYQDVSDQDLDSFLLYTSSLNLRAKIFLVPVKTSYIMGIIVIVSFITLLLFQTEVIRIWL